jgi:ABC-type antimicrobial peptide transport system permease subunit
MMPLAGGGEIHSFWAVDRDQPVAEVATLQDVVAANVSRPRLLAGLVGGFGALAERLAALGIYGVIAYGVRRRTRDIGIQRALGASRDRVVGQVVRQGLGLAGGLLAGLAAAPLLASLLFEVEPFDPGAIAIVVIVVTAAALAGSYLPAREASRVDPLTAIRMA